MKVLGGHSLSSRQIPSCRAHRYAVGRMFPPTTGFVPLTSRDRDLGRSKRSVIEKVDRSNMPVMSAALPSSVQNILLLMSSSRGLMTTQNDGPMASPSSSGDTTPISEAETLVTDDFGPGEVPFLDTISPGGTAGKPRSKSTKVSKRPPPHSGVDWKYGRQG